MKGAYTLNGLQNTRTTREKNKH